MCGIGVGVCMALCRYVIRAWQNSLAWTEVCEFSIDTLRAEAISDLSRFSISVWAFVVKVSEISVWVKAKLTMAQREVMVWRSCVFVTERRKIKT